MVPHLPDNVLNSSFDRMPRLIRDVVVDFGEIPRHVVRESSSAGSRRSGEGMQCRWEDKGRSIGGVKLYEGTTNGGEARSWYPDLRIIGVRDWALVVVDKLFT